MIHISPEGSALIAASLTALISLLYRTLQQKRECNAWDIGFLNSALGTVLLGAIITIPSPASLTTASLLLLFLSGTMWTGVVVLDIMAYGEMDVGLNALLKAGRFALLTIVGALLFSEPLGILRVAGVALIVAAIMYGSPLGAFRINRGIMMRMGSIACVVVAMFLDKYLTTLVPVNAVVIAGYLVPTAWIVLLKPASLTRVVPAIRATRGMHIVCALLFTVMGYFLVHGLGDGALSTTMILYEAKIILSFAAAVLFLGEREQLRVRTLAILAAFAGIVLAMV